MSWYEILRADMRQGLHNVMKLKQLENNAEELNKIIHLYISFAADFIDLSCVIHGQQDNV